MRLASILSLLLFMVPVAGHADQLSKVKSAQVLVVANTQGHAPWDFLDEKNTLTGLGVELVREVAKRMGVAKVEFKPARFADLIPGVQSGRFDLAVAGHTITPARQKIVDFSAPYMAVGTSIFVRKGDKRFTKLSDMEGKAIGVLAGSIQEKYLAKEFGPGKVKVKTYENPTQALTDLSFARVDGVIYSDDAGSYIAGKKNLAVERGLQVNQEVNAMVFRKGEKPFGDALNKALGSIIKDGTYAKMSRKWLNGLDMAAELAKHAK